jgi:hypothetical protein
MATSVDNEVLNLRRLMSNDMTSHAKSLSVDPRRLDVFEGRNSILCEWKGFVR